MAAKKKKHIFRNIFLVILILGILCAAIIAFTNYRIITQTSDRILSFEKASSFEADCVLVLGAGVRDDGSPSHMLEDRLKTGVALYDSGTAPKLLMSGDHGSKDYNEVSVMKEFAVKHGISSSDIFMDHAGFSTYESLYRARDVFKAERIVIVSQGYHLYRALYIAQSLGIDAVGVSADLRTYSGQDMRDIREIAARTKDFFMCIFHPKPTYLGDAIPVSGNGDLTND